MTDASSETKGNVKKMAVSATEFSRVVPKLATKVLLSKIGSNTVLTFVMDTGDDGLHVIETIALDSSLHDGLLQLLKNNAKESGDEK